MRPSATPSTGGSRCSGSGARRWARPAPGAPGGRAAAEGGPQPSKAGRKGRARKGRSRPRDMKQRPAHSVRLNDQEIAVIQAGADHVGMSVAGFLAHSALAAARDQSRTAAAIATERDILTALFGVRRQLGWAGSNVNQIARALNSGAAAPDVAAALADLQRAAQAVQRAADRVAGGSEGEAA
ncbi:plasmid mobilization relaxosome protein MobC [Streptomyces verrucosisporus]|nr:plasmid mobilization relaxosome protein MobC [Streptomyces verrucosisporus]